MDRLSMIFAGVPGISFPDGLKKITNPDDAYLIAKDEFENTYAVRDTKRNYIQALSQNADKKMAPKAAKHNRA